MKYFRNSILVLVILMTSFFASANNAKNQQITDTTSITDTAPAIDTLWAVYTEPIDSINEKVDSLSALWFDKQVSLGNDTSFITPDTAGLANIPEFPDSVYRERLRQLPLMVEVSYNSMIRNYIHLYTHKRIDLVENMLGLADYYFPIFEEIFDSKQMPIELKYLAVIESALNPNAVSKVGATGLWQFMYGTGRLYKLEINSLIDERRDPIKATYAAANFLNDMYKTYHDWILVIAAYNCGPGNVNKAIRRSGGKRNYWDIYYYLPRETRGYVPAFIAATYVMNYYAEHNLKANKSSMPILCDSVMLNQNIHFEQISHFMNISVDQLRNLNPQFRHDIIPAATKPYALRLPANQILRFIDLQDSISHYKDSLYFNPSAMERTPVRTAATGKPGLPPKGNYTKLIYTVKSGDNLGYISSWYNVRVDDIKYWNGLLRNTIRAGQKLTVYVPTSKVSKYKNINTMSFSEKQASVGKSSTTTTQQQSSSSNNNTGEFETYTVKRGDTLWEIAKMYNGVSEADIMSWNNLSSASKIYVGQKLKIKR